jgi:hypothetical protein
MNKLFKLSFILLIAITYIAITQNFCFSANWLLATTENDGLKVYVDKDSIQVDKNNGQIKLWTKALMGNGYYIIGYNIFYFREKKYIILSAISYDKDGNKLAYQPEISEGKKDYIIPDSIYDYVFNFVMEITGLK